MAQIGSPKRKQQSNQPAKPSVIDPSAMSWESYRQAISKGKALRDYQVTALKNTWNKAQAYKAPADTTSLEAQNAAAAAAEKDPKVQAAAAAAAAANAKGSQVGGTGGTNASNWSTNYTISYDNNGNAFVTGKGTTDEILFLPPSTPGGHIKATTNAQIGQSVQSIIKSLGGAAKAKAALAAAGYGTNDIYGNIMNAIRKYSIDSLQTAIDTGGKFNFPSMAQFISGLGKYNPSAKTTGSSNKTSTTVRQAITDRAGTDRDINAYMFDNFGRIATVQEKLDYYNEVDALEKKTKISTKSVPDGSGGYKTVTDTGSTLTTADYDVIKAKVAQKALKTTSVDDLLNSASPGKIATDINSVLAYAADYAIPLTSQQAMKYLSDASSQKDPLAAVKTRLQGIAVQVHPNFKDHITGGGTVKDVADTYAGWYEQKLGKKINDSTKDKTIMAAATAGVDKNTFDRQLQALPEWRTTAEAHSIASDFANTILTSFGFGGN